MQRATRLRQAGRDPGRGRRVRVPAAAERRQPERLRGGRRQRTAGAGRAAEHRRRLGPGVPPAPRTRSARRMPILAMDISGWATGKDLFYFSVTDALQPEVDKAYAFLAPLGLAANQTGETWDLLAQQSARSRLRLLHDASARTAGGIASDTASISSRSFNRYAEWLRLWNVKAQKRWVLWQIPLGNSNHLNVYNNGARTPGLQGQPSGVLLRRQRRRAHAEVRQRRRDRPVLRRGRLGHELATRTTPTPTDNCS